MYPAHAGLQLFLSTTKNPYNENCTSNSLGFCEAGIKCDTYLPNLLLFSFKMSLTLKVLRTCLKISARMRASS